MGIRKSYPVNDLYVIYDEERPVGLIIDGKQLDLAFFTNQAFNAIMAPDGSVAPIEGGAGGTAYGKYKVAPATGDTITIPNDASIYIVDPAADLATLTINMPAAPTNMQPLTIIFRKAVAALTIAGNGKALNGVFGSGDTVPANGTIGALYSSSDNAWDRTF